MATTEQKQIVGKMIREGKSQYEISLELGLSQSTVCRIEHALFSQTEFSANESLYVLKRLRHLIECLESDAPGSVRFDALRIELDHLQKWLAAVSKGTGTRRRGAM